MDTHSSVPEVPWWVLKAETVEDVAQGAQPVRGRPVSPLSSRLQVLLPKSPGWIPRHCAGSTWGGGRAAWALGAAETRTCVLGGLKARLLLSPGSGG